MDYDTIRFEQAEGLALITLNRPEVMNALNTQMRAEICDAYRSLGADVRVAVITGTGRAFCSGQDLGDRANLADIDLEATLRDEYEPMLRAMLDCRVPTIAAVNGVAAGAGANLALSCDVVIAAESASFVQAFTRIGLMPDAGGTYRLPRLVGQARAMGAALFADKVPARTAAQWGMIWEAVADDAFEAEWRSRARHLASGPTEGYVAVKEALRATWSNDLDEQLALESGLQGRCGRTRDFKEGVMSFLEKRPPSFEGR